MEEHTPAPSVPWHRQPIWLGLLGLALMLGGWKLSTFVPAHERAALLNELRGMADDPALKDRIDQIARNARRAPPYQLPGRLVVFAGLALFVLAGMRMYRQPHVPTAGETQTTDDGHVMESH
jgi:hypothetical protein